MPPAKSANPVVKATLEENKKKMGRPVIEFNETLFKNLIGIGCSEREIAVVMQISPDTILFHCRKLYNKTFSEYYKENRAMTRRAQLRNKLWDSNSPAVMIFLAKNELGYSENPVSDEKDGELMRALSEAILD